ncbi:hypothetical protein AB0C70_42570 [Streptomyces sp. NPDC048564]|uniref:hypothetical protein n=1 Tax=Streptomyces sp. NPDC048564 TaxID=3155760 RepID=UPI003418BD1B
MEEEGLNLLAGCAGSWNRHDGPREGRATFVLSSGRKVHSNWLRLHPVRGSCFCWECELMREMELDSWRSGVRQLSFDDLGSEQ